MTDAKEKKLQVYIRLPLAIQDWLFSEAVEAAKIQPVGVSVPSVIVAKLSKPFDENLVEHDEEAALMAGEKKAVLLRLPKSLYESLYTESVQLSDSRRVRVTVPSLVVEKLSRLHRQAQAANPQSSA